MILSSYLTESNRKRRELLLDQLAGGPLIKKVTTKSMLPTIKPGDDVIIYDQKVRVGEVAAVLLASGDIMVHRLIGVTSGRLMLKGDNCGWFELCSPTMLLGKVQTPRMMIRSWFQRIYFAIKIRTKSPGLLQERIIHSASVDKVLLFNIYDKKTLRLAREIEGIFPKPLQCQTLEIETLSAQEAHQQLCSIIETIDEESFIRAFFLSRQAQLDLTEEFNTLAELLELDRGQNRDETIREVMTTCKMKIMAK